LFDDDDFGINRRRAAAATSDRAETKAKVPMHAMPSSRRSPRALEMDSRPRSAEAGRDAHLPRPRGAGAVISLVACRENCVHHSSETEIEMSERSFQIRDATVADVPIILQLIRDLATYERAPNDVLATEEGLREVLFGAEPAARVVIAFENAAPVGFAVYFFNFSTWLGRPGLYLEDLFVKPEMRGRGYGRALLAHLAKIARDQNCGRMEWAVLTWNDPAIQFYNKLGAVPLEEWRVFRLTKDGIGKLAET